jgi:peptidoglycan hydrolase-like protein with peptidoglycan-binding domain
LLGQEKRKGKMNKFLKIIPLIIGLLFVTSGCNNTSEIALQVSPQPTKTPLPTASSSPATSTPKITTTQTPEQQRDLKLGVEGADVQALAQQLLSLGYAEVGLVDGIFDIQDEAAVKHFQLLSNLPITGVVDEVTWGALSDSNPAAYYLPPAFPGKVAQVNSTTMMCDDHALQDRLAVMEYLQPGSEEWSIGSFGPETRDALMEFQKYYMPEADGIPDLESWKKVFSPIPHWTFGGAMVSVEDWPTSIYPADQNLVAMAWDGSRLWLAVSKGTYLYENYLIRIDPNEHPAEAVTIIRPRDCEIQYSQIVNMVYSGGKIWLLYSTDAEGNPVPLLQTIDPESGVARTPFEFASCPDGFCFPATGMGVTKGQLWVAASDRAYSIDPSSGRVLVSRPVGYLASAKMVYDGQCFWYLGEANVTSFNPLGGACRQNNSDNMLFYGYPETDGTLVWTANYDGTFSQLNLNTGVTIPLEPMVSSPSSMVYGLKNLWIADNETSSIVGYSPELGNHGEPIPFHGVAPTLMLYESSYLWVYYWESASVERINIENYAITATNRTATPVFTATPSPTPPVLSRTLSLTNPNMQGDDVLMLQNALLELGYSELGVADGSFGKLTDKAVRRFQEENGLTVDGIVGPQTWARLFTK